VILVDSSVWIDWLRGAETEAVRFVRARQDTEELALTSMIYLEVLQGIRLEAHFLKTRDVLGAQLMVDVANGLDSYAAAASLYRRARQQGRTIRRSTDCLIAAIAIEQGALLVHNDRDFLAIARTESALQIYPRHDA
jgi:predicted nucleic acid-binding protein